ncbi:UDP-N-acetylmuramoyl-tripeptide--D-alanyl-D-alanine ligase [Maribacter sp. HTCC2170]|uniref:UDP-N-acetylmuramoyl-tripeptide--D-alanyl-D- alanine ligase n=1 Tax=Maribacter sp. (strain HTCC2170 / KCCM 42371) TaxID=313603 RepID=UPI00006B1AA5|nr:UDP-N-acetylmuramoyl-tripeptide--D-alanyl-D-alanine ligase [Maribacter sp. HTCC2170]EAR00882.1 UDP-N-acetylmuramoylalanyl-D-glutamyl-2, 6-diaminopimelate-D-alanyl-D-alanyl ligase [Maribacter sp. HTCC2170]
MNIEQLHQIFLQFPLVCTDTRKIKINCLFFALKGDNFNGNEYADEALKKGASYSIVDEEKYATSDKTILVKDVLQTLQKLATFHRNFYSAKVIGLTGSNGKTTTKELVNAVLSSKYKTIATIGNLNNHIGVPLTLLTIKEDTEIAIVEMGANHQKEIEFLCSLAQPDYGYITNFGKAHLEGFGSVEGVIEGKSELYDYLLANQKSIFLNADDPIQHKKLGHYIKKYGFTTAKKEYFKIKFLISDPYVSLSVEDIEINSKLIGNYNFTNCCAAVLMGKYFNVELNDIKTAIESYIPQNNRSQIIESNGTRIILDAYNANPTSMKVALENFNSLSGEPKIAFLGDMFELGATSNEEHQNIADLTSSLDISEVFLVGDNFYRTKTPLKKFKNYEALALYLADVELPSNSTILIKGSRGMALERLLELL